MAATDGFRRSCAHVALLALGSATSSGCILFFHTEAGGDGGSAGAAQVSVTGGSGGQGPGAGGQGTTGGSAPCPNPVVKEVATFPSIAELPDPFTFQDGTRVTSPNDWDRRRAEISARVQQFQYGPYPPSPSSVTGALSGTTLTVTVEYGGKTISFTATVSLPSGSGPFPAYVGFASATFPAPIDAGTLTARGIASIAYDPSQLSGDGTGYRGVGKFYDLYGTAFKAGALMAWAWGVHRIVDALAQLGGFDATKVAVQGFSRWGKAALVTGALDPRIALTVVSSSGAGGVGSWRDAESVGSSVQTLSEIAAEANWFVQDFGQNFGCRVKSLPFDGHSIVALVAPRPILVTEGSQDTWNNPKGCFNSVWAAREVFEYLGVPDRLGFRSSPTSHAFSADEKTAALTFMDRFLLGQAVDTNVFDQTFPVDPNAAPWSAP